MIGHDLAGRYEILTRIGGGGMALVYKAHDVLLNRNVAVKVLRQQFVGDDEFVRRFRREAQSAAALSHPNVVSIYDVGQEDETHYIVMEYVDGHNLNEIIQERAPLQTDEAIRIAIQICDALDHAHQNHIIHRDIKPHNILIGNNGRVKVTDFGIARAVTSTTITQTGSVVGSVHYFSPEHAKGINTGEKSDLYSLGIVLYQMLTGRLPFLGESPISVALKHLQETFEEPREVNPHIPQSVENVILKAMRKNPAERYGSAKEMLADLDSCLRPERLNEPKAVFAAHYDMEETKVMPAIRGEAANVQDSVKRDTQPVPADATGRWNAENGGAAAKGAKGWQKPLIVVAVTLVALALLAWGFTKLLDQLNPDEVEVPYVIDKTLDEARQMIEEAGLRVKEPVHREFSKDIPKDVVFDQSKQNMRVKEGAYIELYVSDGPELKPMGSYVGGKLQTAKDELAALGIVDDRIEVKEEHSEDEPGTVLEQNPPAGQPINPETDRVSFVVSLGRETVEMPDLVDMTLADAQKLLKALGLVLNEADIIYEPSYIFPKGDVTQQDNYQPMEMVPKGSTVTIRVSTGIPSDAISYNFVVRISPAVYGQSSEVKILYSDATGENLDGGTHTINGPSQITVPLVLAPDSSATVSVYRDKEFIDSRDIEYKDLQSGSADPGITVPGGEPPATEEPIHEPAQGEMNEDHGETEGGSEEGEGH